MDATIADFSKCEVRGVIRFLHHKGTSPIEIHRELISAYGPNVMDIKNVRKWCREFSGGRTNVHDEPGRGRPSISDEVVARVDELVREDRRLTVREICAMIPDVSKTTVDKILRDTLGFNKVCARWVPRQLTDEHKRKRIESSREFLRRHEEEGEQFLDSIVTGDETWVHYFTPESKQKSMQWRHPSSPTVKKFKTTPSAGKIMATVFWDRHGVLLIEYLPRGQTINADRYAQTLQNLKQAIRDKRKGRLTKGVCLLHDNARPHVARKILELLAKFGWDVLEHPPYSPDLAPSDYHVFPALKEHLSGQRFENDEEVTEAVNRFLREAGKNWYDTGINKLVVRLQKCIDRNGDYVEK